MAKIEALDVPDIKVSPTKRERVINKIKTNSPVHKKSIDAQVEIRKRMGEFMRREHSLPVADPLHPQDQFEQEWHPIEYDPMNPTG